MARRYSHGTKSSGLNDVDDKGRRQRRPLGQRRRRMESTLERNPATGSASVCRPFLAGLPRGLAASFGLPESRVLVPPVELWEHEDVSSAQRFGC